MVLIILIRLINHVVIGIGPGEEIIYKIRAVNTFTRNITLICFEITWRREFDIDMRNRKCTQW